MTKKFHAAAMFCRDAICECFSMCHQYSVCYQCWIFFLLPASHLMNFCFLRLFLRLCISFQLSLFSSASSSPPSSWCRVSLPASSYFHHRFLLLWLLYNALKMSKDLCECCDGLTVVYAAPNFHIQQTYLALLFFFLFVFLLLLLLLQCTSRIIHNTDINFSFDIISQ